MNPIKILLIGNDPDIHKTLRRKLVSRGCEVLLALDDAEAYEQTSRIEPDLLLLNPDLCALRADGLALCEPIHKISQTRAWQIHQYGLLPGNQADLVVFDALCPEAIITDQAEKLFVIKDGHLTAENPLQNSQFYSSSPEQVGIPLPWQGEAPIAKISKN